MRAPIYSSGSPPAARLPPKRGKPQRRGNIGAGKLDADEAAFTADVQAFELERAEQAALVKEHSGFKSGFESAIVSAAGGSVTASMRQTASAVCASGVRVLCSQQRMWTASGTGKHRAERFPLHCGYLL